jgi:hypothetical protein
VPGQGIVKFLVGVETEGFNIGVEEWVLARAHQGIVLQGVLHGLLFEGGAACRDFEEYQRFLSDYRELKAGLYRVLESFSGPGPMARAVLRKAGEGRYIGPIIKYFAYRLHGRDMMKLLRRFSRKWIKGRQPAEHTFEIALTGEVYMRVAQSEEIFRLLLANLGFRRFRLEFAPLWSYMEWAFDEVIETHRDKLGRLQTSTSGSRENDEAKQEIHKRIRMMRTIQTILRKLIAGPLYRAAGIHMPVSTAEVLKTSRELLPTLRPLSEIATYLGEALSELRKGTDIVLNVAPNGCMVASMGEVLTPAIIAANVTGHGRIQQLFSAEGDVNEELLTLALLKAMGPEHYYRAGTSLVSMKQSATGFASDSGMAPAMTA